MTLVAAVSAAVAVLLWRPSGQWLARVRLGGSRTAPPGLRFALPWACALIGAGVLGPLLIGLPAPRAMLLATVSGVAAFAFRQLRAERRRRHRNERRLAVTDAVGLIAAELRAGILPQRVLAGLVVDFPFLAAAAHTAELGGDIPTALRLVSAEPGGELLADLAGAWHVAERSGAPLARVLDRLEETARDDHEIEREVQSGLAPARATGRLMAALPLFGLTLGSGMGGDPVEVLTGTMLGAACLAAGAALACAGVAWVESIATSGEDDP